LPRRLSEILADYDTALRQVQAAPLLQAHKPALRCLELNREALRTIAYRLERCEDIAGARDVTL